MYVVIVFWKDYPTDEKHANVILVTTDRRTAEWSAKTAAEIGNHAAPVGVFTVSPGVFFSAEALIEEAGMSFDYRKDL